MLFTKASSIFQPSCSQHEPVALSTKSRFPRGSNTKKLIIDWVSAKYPKDFTYELTRHGNPKPGTDDKADAVVVALAGLKKYKKDNNYS